MAQDVLDSASFQAGQGGLATFPAEPTPVPIDYALVPGNLGEVWMGVIANQMFTGDAGIGANQKQRGDARERIWRDSARWRLRGRAWR